MLTENNNLTAVVSHPHWQAIIAWVDLHPYCTITIKFRDKIPDEILAATMDLKVDKVAREMGLKK